MKSIKELPISNAKILMRVDFNVPLDDKGTITDDTRIKGVLPTIEYARKKNAAIILISHCGRPKGKKQAKFSMAPAAKRLAQLLDHEVKFAPDCIGQEVNSMVEKMVPGDILLLENLRFHDGETKNNPIFAHGLGQLADIYVNDAFAVSHRAHASVEGVTHHVKECGAGLLLKKEMDFFQRSVSQAKSPLIAILGGAKVSSKLGAIRHMLDKVDKMIIGGAMANTFLKSQGVEIGSSLVENDLLDTAKELLNLAKDKGVTIHLPTDCVVAEQFSAEADHKIVNIQDVPANWSILDIGPGTEKLFAAALEDANTIVWNGPMGAFEMEPYAHGSMAIAQVLSESKALTVVGGGDTNALINKANVQKAISYMSTGGGAFLMLMEGKELPGVNALEKVNKKKEQKMPNRRPLLAGNWKMNLTIVKAQELAALVVKSSSDVTDRDIMIAPSFTALSSVAEILSDSNVILAGQNVCWQESGAFTGEISPQMLKDTTCKMAIIGHSERRHIFAEDEQLINKRLSGCLAHDIIPVLCVGETLSIRESDKTFDVLEEQLRQGLNGISINSAEELVIAYEPVWAIGTGKTASAEQAQEVHAFLRKILAEILQKDIAAGIRILYGGSVNSDNVDMLMAEPDIDGALVGGAALDYTAFDRIIHFK